MHRHPPALALLVPALLGCAPGNPPAAGGAAGLTASASPAADAAPSLPELRVGDGQVLLAPTQRAALGFSDLPDGPLVALRAGGEFHWFASAATSTPAHRYAQGTYRLAGTLETLAPEGAPVPSLRDGAEDPSPDGSDFDHDYAGGGAVVPFRDASTGVEYLLHFYHGEIHYLPSGFPFYAALGLAISSDGGKTFRKLGEIVRPRTPRGPYPLPVGSALPPIVQASTPSVVEHDGYLYLFYTDTAPAGEAPAPCDSAPCVAVARASAADVMKAALDGGSAGFRKYFGGAFVEPAISGRFTPILSGATAWQSSPWTTFHPALRRFVMVHTQGNAGIFARWSTDLIHWSDPQALVGTSWSSVDGHVHGRIVLYPSLIGAGDDPASLGASFWLYYVASNDGWPSWSQAYLVRRALSLMEAAP